MGAILSPRAGDLARALREQAPPREIARIALDAEPARDPVPFRTISGPLEARLLQSGKYAGRPIFWATHSATNTQDLHGTWWSPRALEAMRGTAADGLTMFLNHSYDVPEDVLGMSVEARLEERADARAGTRHTDLDIATLAVPEDVNPRAMQTYRAIQAGVKLGQSVGVFILDWAWMDPDGNRLAEVEEDFFGPVPYAGEAPEARLTIDDVLLVESSTVGIPSNRRGWVHEAARALRRAGVLPERAARRPTRHISIPTETRSADVEPEQNPAAQPDAARCADCGCACRAGAPDAGCTCDCAGCGAAREGAQASAAAVPGGDPASLEPERASPAPDATLAIAGRSLDELDAALNAAGGIVAGPAPEPGPAERAAPGTQEDHEARARRKAEKRAAKQARRSARARPDSPAADASHAAEQLSALQAEIAAARALRDELAAEAKALRKAAKQAARAIADADQTGLYRPTCRADALASADMPAKALVAMSDAEALAALRARIPA